MNELYYEITLLDDVVLSQKTATAGDHKSLDYIPGSAILGAIAARFYNAFDKEAAWKIFHSANVRFCNAYPQINGHRSIPMPLAIHSEKTPEKGNESKVYNFTQFHKDERIQYKQTRCGFVVENGLALSNKLPQKTSRMRTAIDAHTGAAAKSQLYGYESLDAGQRFVGKILWNDSVNTDLAKILSIFENGETIHIGRSKTASYGRARIAPKNTAAASPQSVQGNTFSIIAMSDLFLRNSKTGAPELTLPPEALGLNNENWSIDYSKTFVRPTSVFQYNSYRKELEIQKTLISKGSIFTFTSNSPLTAQEISNIQKNIANGIGFSKEQGFGEIDFYTLNSSYDIQDANENNEEAIPSLTDIESSWLEWLAPTSIPAEVKKYVIEAVQQFKELCKSIISFNAFDKNDPTVLPTNAQWGRILEVSRSSSDLNKALFDGESPIIKPKTESRTDRHGDIKVHNPDPEWNYERGLDNYTLRQWLKGFINSDKLSKANQHIALQELAKRCKNLMSNREWLGGC